MTQPASSSPAAVSRRITLWNVQALRGIAATLVAVLHAVSIASKYAGESVQTRVYDLASFGAVGVDIFFVISGFIMVYVAGDQFQKAGAVGNFLSRRVIRIAPVYWLYTSVYLVLLLLLPGAFGTDTFVFWHTVKSYLFIPTGNEVTGSPFPVLTPGWTLTFEMYFYLVFAGFLLFPRRYFLPGITVFFCGSTAFSLLDFEQASILGTITNPLLIEFLLGCFIGHLFVSGFRCRIELSRWLAIIGAVALAASIFYGCPDVDDNRGGFPRLLAWGLPSVLLVFGAVFAEREREGRHPRWLLAVGDSSYSLYLTHVFTQPVMGKVWAKAGLSDHLPADVFVVLAVLASMAVGHVAYLLIEKPLSRRLRPKKRPSQAETN